ncbi:MFS transporter [Pseudorhodoferax soli]|jgi:predicted MFS family arabinose efflux permease|uniref:Putative MFS family arabinose efflux permease n=1 Tax=Pseudorhodoferax soli TaxID=545864 RepID=A0A368XY39_9BURK|nr:MFS transporter [Pseudorhodoferax soli]RCW72911.1 putative MFS family arabinose efflux permease [Pseudorhodoferax soli]
MNSPATPPSLARQLLPLMAVMVLVHLAFTGGRVALSLYAIALHAPTVVVGLQVSLLSVLPMLLSVRLGRWIDRVGMQRPARIATAISAVGVALPALWPSVPVLCLASMLLGSGFMLLHMTVYNEVGHSTTDETRVRAFTLLALAFSTSTVMGPVIAGIAIDGIGHRWTFALLVLFPLLALAVLVALRIRVAPRNAPGGVAGAGQVMDLLRNPRMRAVFIVSGLLSMGWDMFTFMVPVQGARIGLSASTIGLIMGCFGVATFVVRLAMPVLQRHLNEWQTLTISLGVTAAVYLLFPLTTAVPLLLALAFVNGLSLGSTQPMVMSLVHQVAPPGRSGEALGVRATIMNASQVFLPILFGGLGSAAGMGPAFWTLAAILSGGTAYARRVSRDA